MGVGFVFIVFLFWSNLGVEDGVIEVLVCCGEVVVGRFIEVFCFEDYDSYCRFEGCIFRKCGRGVIDVVIIREEVE